MGLFQPWEPHFCRCCSSVRRDAQWKNILKKPNRIPSNANHGPGICTPTFAQHKSPTCRHNIPYMENSESPWIIQWSSDSGFEHLFRAKKWKPWRKFGPCSSYMAYFPSISGFNHHTLLIKMLFLSRDIIWPCFFELWWSIGWFHLYPIVSIAGDGRYPIDKASYTVPSGKLT